jgi:hypothetical protein
MTTLLAIVLLAACSSNAPSDTPASAAGTTTDAATSQSAYCAAVTTAVLNATQRYVDGYGTPLEVEPAIPRRERRTPTQTLGDGELRATLEEAGRDLRRHDCDPALFQQSLRDGLAGVTARGAVARAMLLHLQSSLTGLSNAEPQTRSVAPGDNLAEELAGAAPGSTVELAAGSYELDRSLVLLQGVTLRGAGRNRTTIRSSASDAAVLVLTDGRVEVSDMTVRHVGPEPAPVMIGGPSASVVLTGARIAGATSARGERGGTGVLMSARDGEVGDRGTTLEVTGSQFVGHAAAGVLLDGGHRASITTSEFRNNGQCGVCFVGASSGAVRNSSFVANGAGVAVDDDARPALTGDTFRNGQVAVQVSGSAAAVVKGATVTGAGRAALIFSDQASGRVEGTTCRDVSYGIVVAPSALPYVGDNECSVARSE